MYNATLYFNSGFNAINIPDSPATLARATTKTYPALDIYQARELSSFTIRATYNDIRNADYLYLVSSEDATDFAYYSIKGITMTSKDTAVLDVLMDYILTAGGVSGLQFTDGMVERHHIPSNSDDFGVYDEDDPYIYPAEMMKIKVEEPDLRNNKSDKNVLIVAASADLRTYYDKCESTNTFPDAMVYRGYNAALDPNNPVDVAVPMATASNSLTIAHMGKGSGTPYETMMPYETFYTYNPNESEFTDGNWPNQTDVGWLPDAMRYIRGLNGEDSILYQYAIPYYMIYNSTFGSSVVGHLTPDFGEFLTLQGTRYADPLLDLPYIPSEYLSDYRYTVQNNRLFYGEHCKYTIVSIASGNSAEFLPEEIYDGTSCPSIEMRVDPRPDGCPYFRFETYRGDRTDSMFFVNCVKGLGWQNVPLVYRDASGGILAQYQYAAKKAYLQNEYGQQYLQADLQSKKFWGDAIGNMGGGVARGVDVSPTPEWAPTSVAGQSVMQGQSYGLGAQLGAAASYTGAQINTGISGGAANRRKAYLQEAYDIAMSTEYQDLMIAQNAFSPTINFPISPSIRDYVGNTCIVYRTYYTENDIKRLDKILNMYGYKHTVPMDASYLTNRSKFNYIKARGVSIGNTTLPKWLRDGIALQFSIGMRIWHQLPDITAYTDGSNT